MPLPKLPRELQAQFTADDLPGQYLLSRDRDLLPDNWLIAEKDGWLLACHPSLPCLPLRGVSGEQVGFLLGFPITEEGELLEDRQQGFALAGAVPLESSLYTLSGRWLAIVLTAGEQCIYLDPAGSLPAVYSPSLALAGASTALFPYTRDTADRVDLIEAMPIPHLNASYPPGMTPRVGISRLLPNHRLDLQTWQAQRHWPISDVGITSDPTGTAMVFAEHLKKNIAAVAARCPLLLSLTAGRDSRTILACARPFLDEAVIFTDHLPGTASVTDMRMAKRITRKMGLNHDVRSIAISSPREQALWLFRSGGAVGNYGSFLSMPRTRETDKHRAYLPGYMFVTARNYYVPHLNKRDPAWRDQGLDARVLLSLIYAPIRQETVQVMETWLENQPFSDLRQAVALFYVEERLGAWQAVCSLPHADKTALELWPVSSRPMVEIMLTLPEAYCAAYQLHDDIIAREWPELLQFRFNQPGFMDRVECGIRRRMPHKQSL